MGAGHHPRTRKERERGPRRGGKGHHDRYHDPHRRGDQRRPTPTKHPNTHHRSKHRTPCGSHQRTPTGHRKPHGERRAHLHGENGPHPQRRPQGTPPHGAPPCPHHQPTTPTTTKANSGTRRGRKHGRGTHDYGPTPPEDTGPRHRPPGRATPRTVTRPHHGL